MTLSMFDDVTCRRLYPITLFPHIEEGVGLVAVNDALWIEGTIYKILRQHFRSEPYYVNILELFHEVRPHPLQLNFVSFICQCKFAHI